MNHFSVKVFSIQIITPIPRITSNVGMENGNNKSKRVVNSNENRALRFANAYISVNLAM